MHINSRWRDGTFKLRRVSGANLTNSPSINDQKAKLTGKLSTHLNISRDFKTYVASETLPRNSVTAKQPNVSLSKNQADIAIRISASRSHTNKENSVDTLFV